MLKTQTNICYLHQEQTFKSFSRAAIKGCSYRCSSPMTSKKSSIKGSQTEQNLNLPFWPLSPSHESRCNTTVFSKPADETPDCSWLFQLYFEHQQRSELAIYPSFSAAAFLSYPKSFFRCNTGGRHWMHLQVGKGKKNKSRATQYPCSQERPFPFSSHTHIPQIQIRGCWCGQIIDKIMQDCSQEALQ